MYFLHCPAQEQPQQARLQQHSPSTSPTPPSHPRDPSPSTTTTAWPKERENAATSGGGRTNRPLNFGIGIRDPLTESAEEGSQNNPTAVREEFKRMVHETVDSSVKPGPPSTLPNPPLSQAPGSKATAAVQKPAPVSVTAAALKVPGGGGGGQTLLKTTPTSVFVGTLNNVVNNDIHVGDQDDDAVFSPSSTDDEHMKHIEKVCAHGGIGRGREGANYMYSITEVPTPMQAAEALLSTEEEDTPTPSPTTSTLPRPQPSAPTNPHTLPTTPAQPPLPKAVNPDDLHKWLYKDPQGEIQGEMLFICN